MAWQSVEEVHRGQRIGPTGAWISGMLLESGIGPNLEFDIRKQAGSGLPRNKMTERTSPSCPTRRMLTAALSPICAGGINVFFSISS